MYGTACIYKLKTCLKIEDIWSVCPPPGLAAGWPAVDAKSWLSAHGGKELWPPEPSMLDANNPSTKLPLASACIDMEARWLNRSSSNWLVLVSTQKRMQDSTSGASFWNPTSSGHNGLDLGLWPLSFHHFIDGQELAFLADGVVPAALHQDLRFHSHRVATRLDPLTKEVSAILIIKCMGTGTE